MKGCQVRDWIVGERDMSFSRILYMTCRWRLINALNFQYHGLIIQVGNQRNVTMATYGKSFGGIYPNGASQFLYQNGVVI